MKIYYKQTQKSFLINNDISNCYFKELETYRDFNVITEKPHIHTGYEIHILDRGSQHYIVGNEEFKPQSGEFLLIPPGMTHLVEKSVDNIKKFSITFNFNNRIKLNAFCGKTPQRVTENIAFLLSEAERKKENSPQLIENNVYETIILLLRAAGLRESDAVKEYDNNAFLKLAKSYIKDNIEAAPDVFSVAQYCHLSERQLSRIFNKFENITVSEYIRKKQTEHIEKLFNETDLGIKEVSERMNFSSEYYFNYFFKKNVGMTPGEYRKMNNK